MDESATSLDFRTDGTWTAHELSDLFDDLDATYRTLRVAQHLAASYDRQRDAHVEQQARQMENFREMGPEWDMLIHEWSRWLRRSYKDRSVNKCRGNVAGSIITRTD